MIEILIGSGVAIVVFMCALMIYSSVTVGARADAANDRLLEKLQKRPVIDDRLAFLKEQARRLAITGEARRWKKRAVFAEKALDDREVEDKRAWDGFCDHIIAATKGEKFLARGPALDAVEKLYDLHKNQRGWIADYQEKNEKLRSDLQKVAEESERRREILRDIAKHLRQIFPFTCAFQGGELRSLVERAEEGAK